MPRLSEHYLCAIVILFICLYPSTFALINSTALNDTQAQNATQNSDFLPEGGKFGRGRRPTLSATWFQQELCMKKGTGPIAHIVYRGQGGKNSKLGPAYSILARPQSLIDKLRRNFNGQLIQHQAGMGTVGSRRVGAVSDSKIYLSNETYFGRIRYDLPVSAVFGPAAIITFYRNISGSTFIIPEMTIGVNSSPFRTLLDFSKSGKVLVTAEKSIWSIAGPNTWRLFMNPSSWLVDERIYLLAIAFMDNTATFGL